MSCFEDRQEQERRATADLLKQVAQLQPRDPIMQHQRPQYRCLNTARRQQRLG